MWLFLCEACCPLAPGCVLLDRFFYPSIFVCGQEFLAVAASGHGSRHLKWVRHWKPKCVYISLVSASATVASFCRSLSSVWASSELMTTSGSIFLSRDTHCTLSLNLLASDMISLAKASWGPLYMCIVSKLLQLPVLFEGVGLLLGPKGASCVTPWKKCTCDCFFNRCDQPPYKWVTGVITLDLYRITLLVTG